jgi:O-antigen/teichoic acid export membrane protein
VSARAANALIFIFIGRSIGVAEAGIFQLAITYLLIFSVLTRGLDELVMRQVARFPQEARLYFTTFLVLRLALNVVLYGVLTVIVSFILRYPLNTLVPILIVSIGLISDSLTGAANAVMLGQRRFGLPAMVAVGVCVLRLTVGGALLYLRASLVLIATLWCFSSVIGAVISTTLVGMQVGVLRGQCIFDRSLVSRELLSMLPFMANGTLMAIEFQIDTVLLSVLRGESEVGWYGAATTIVSTLAMIPQAYRLSVYPVMVSYGGRNRQKLVRLYESSLQYLGSLAFPMVAGLVLLAPNIVTLVFGSEFLPSATALQSLAAALLFTFLNVPNVRMMFVCNRQSWVTGMIMGSMLINLVLNLWIIPLLGAQGAALVRFVSSSVFFLTNYIVLQFIVGKLNTNLLRLLWRPALATLLMCGAVALISEWHVLIVVMVGMGVYFCIWLLIGGVSREDRRLIHELLQGPRLSA